MRKTSYILSFLLLCYAIVSAEVLNVENYERSWNMDHVEAPFSLPIVAINEDNKYIQSLLPILDTLTLNDKVELYIWGNIYADSTYYTVFRDDLFTLINRPIVLDNCKGVYKHNYKGKSKYFALLENKTVAPRQYNELYTVTDDTLHVKFTNVLLPDGVYIAKDDIMTSVKCCMAGDSLCVMQFYYNQRM